MNNIVSTPASDVAVQDLAVKVLLATETDIETTNDEVIAEAPLAPINGFAMFNLSPLLMNALAAMDYMTPTDVQVRAIPLAMAQKDLLVSAQTGSGKTGAFLIPILAALLENPDQKVMIMSPTRELAEQTFKVLLQMGSRFRNVQAALLIGGMPIFRQFSRLRANPQVIIGTPGRINDHMERGTLDVSDVQILVLDEADRMLDMGFGIQIEGIVNEMRTKDRQTLMFSATFPKGIKKLTEKYMRDPARIDVGAKHELNKNLTRDIIFVESRGKYQKLMEEIQKREGTVIVFANTKRMADEISDRLYDEAGIKAAAMHGDLKQGQRTRVLTGFRNKQFRVLVATDVAARGLDVPHVEHVINYDLPMAAEDYIHRVGRTARAGATGHALDLVSSQDRSKLELITRLFKGEDMDFVKTLPPRRGGNGGGAPRGGRGDSRGGPSRFSREGGRSEGGRGFSREGGRSEGGRSEGRSFSRDSRPAEGRSFSRDSRPAEGRSFSRDSRPAEGRSFDRDSRPAEGRSFNREGRPAEGRPFNREGRPAEGRSFSRDSRPAEGRSFSREGRPSEGRTFSREGRPSEGRPSEGRTFSRDSKPGEGRFSRESKPGEGRFSRESKPGEGRFSRDRKPGGEARTFSRPAKPAGEGRTFSRKPKSKDND